MTKDAVQFDTSTPKAFLEAFEPMARAHFEVELQEVRTRVDLLLTHPHSAELMRTMIAMNRSRSYLLLRDVLGPAAIKDGPTTLRGLQELAHFVHQAVFSDTHFRTEPHVPKPHEVELYRANVASLWSESPEEAEAALQDWLSRQAELLQIVRGSMPGGDRPPSLTAEEIIAAIKHNERVEYEREQETHEEHGDVFPDEPEPLAP